MIMGTSAGSARTPLPESSTTNITLFLSSFLILYTDWWLLRYVWKCWNWCLCTTWVLCTRLLTNAKKATVSVLYWYTSFPSSLWAQNFWKHKGSSSSEEETSFNVYVFFFCVFVVVRLWCGQGKNQYSPSRAASRHGL